MHGIMLVSHAFPLDPDAPIAPSHAREQYKTKGLDPTRGSQPFEYMVRKQDMGRTSIRCIPQNNT